MHSLDVVYDVCRCFIYDHPEVDPSLRDKILGFSRSRNLDRLASCSEHFDWHCHTVNEWKFLRQIEAFFKKNSAFADPDRCFLAAQESFFASERLCSETNVRLREYVGYPERIPEEFRQYTYRAMDYISKVLGDFHPFINNIDKLIKVTSGATSHSSRRESLPQMKMRLRIYATPRCAKYVKALYHTFGFDRVHVKATHSNRVELVPKNWKTSRTIACEPEGNLPFQLAFDSYAKKRLRFFGIDLSDQSRNQSLAKHASIHDDLVTVDFSAASDTISYNTVNLLFPVDWLKFLVEVRTPFFRGVFGEGVYSKFSSMGNGSTFCIETLLFCAACYAVGSSRFSVYGDDVILEKEFYKEFLAFTRFLGFRINEDKTFDKGPFRESCGLDAWKGCDVTPCYIRGIDRRKAMKCHLVNTLLGVSIPGGKLELYLLEFVRRNKLPLVPFQDSTISGIWILPDKARELGILRTVHCRARFRGYVPRSRIRYFVDSRGYYLWFLRKRNQVAFSKPWFNQNAGDSKGSQTSSAAVFDHAYVRSRVFWQPSEKAIPDHLYWWSELVAPRRKAGAK